MNERGDRRGSGRPRPDAVRGEGVRRARPARLLDGRPGRPPRRRAAAAHLRRPLQPGREGPRGGAARRRRQVHGRRTGAGDRAPGRAAAGGVLARRVDGGRGAGRADPGLHRRTAGIRPARVHRGAPRPARDQRALHRAPARDRARDPRLHEAAVRDARRRRTSRASRSPATTSPGASTSCRRSTTRPSSRGRGLSRRWRGGALRRRTCPSSS